MEQKRFSPLKLIAAMIFILLTICTGIRMCVLATGAVLTLISGQFNAMGLVGQLTAIGSLFMYTLGSLLLAISCFLRKPRTLALFGGAVLLLGAVLVYLISFTDDVIGLVQYGFSYIDQIRPVWVVCHQIWQLLRILTCASLMLVLFLREKTHKVLCFVPSVLAALTPAWYLLYSFCMAIFDHSLNMTWLMMTITTAAILLALLETVGFAPLCLIVSRKEDPVAVEAAAEEVVPTGE